MTKKLILMTEGDSNSRMVNGDNSVYYLTDRGATRTDAVVKQLAKEGHQPDVIFAPHDVAYDMASRIHSLFNQVTGIPEYQSPVRGMPRVLDQVIYRKYGPANTSKPDLIIQTLRDMKDRDAETVLMVLDRDDVNRVLHKLIPASINKSPIAFLDSQAVILQADIDEWRTLNSVSFVGRFTP